MKSDITKVIGILALGGITLAVTANIAFNRSAKGRFGTSNPMTYMEAQVELGMNADAVARAIAPDRIRYHRMQDGAIAQELFFDLDWAPDFKCFIVYRGASVSDIEYEQRYLGNIEPLSAEQAEEELGVTALSGKKPANAVR